VKQLESGGTCIFVDRISEHTRQPFMVDPERFGRCVGKNVTIREIPILPENTAKGKIAPQVIIGQTS